MKNTLLLGLLISLSVSLIAQVPQAFNYQAVARDSSGDCYSEQLISLQISILDSSVANPLVYREEFRNVLTNQQGLFSILIGTGISQPIGGQTPPFESIIWASGNHWMEVKMDPSNGFNFILVGSQQLLSVPYSMYSDEASKANTATIADTAMIARNVMGEPIGTVKMFWDAGGILSVPIGWQVLDGTVVSDPLSPLNGIQLPNMVNRYAVGALQNTDTTVVGNTNHTISLAHSHTVDNHQHSMPSHTHSMSHTHSAGTYSTLFGWDDQGDVAVRKGSISSYGGWLVSFNDALNTEGNLSFGNVQTSEFSSNTASVQVAGNSGGSSSSSTGSGGGGSTGSANPGTSSQLSTIQSIQPESIGFIYIIKVR